MDNFQLKKCCFCVNLRTGSLIIGVLGLLANLFILMFAISGFINIYDESKYEEAETGVKTSVTWPVAVASLTFIFLNLVFLVVFFHGMFKYNHKCIYVYLVYTIISIIFSAMMCFRNIITQLGLLGIFFEMVVILMNIYFFFVVRSYYMVMGTGPSRPYLHPTPPSGHPPKLSGTHEKQPKYPNQPDQPNQSHPNISRHNNRESQMPSPSRNEKHPNQPDQPNQSHPNISRHNNRESLTQSPPRNTSTNTSKPTSPKH